MEQYVIRGGNPLVGEVEIGVAKNAALAILTAATMTDETVLIENLPDVSDINVLLEAIAEIGATVDRIDRHTVRINASTIGDLSVDYEYIKKIRLTQKRIYHIIIFFLRQVLFYIFLHIFYTISDIAIISSFLTPQYQSKDSEIVRICAGRHLDLIPTVHRYQTFLIEDTHKYPDQDISVIYETQDAIFLNDLKGRLTSLCIAHNGESQKDNPYYYKEFNCPQQRSCYLVHAMQHR